MFDTRAGQDPIGDFYNAAGSPAARAARRFPTQPQLISVATTYAYRLVPSRTIVAPSSAATR